MKVFCKETTVAILRSPIPSNLEFDKLFHQAYRYVVVGKQSREMYTTIVATIADEMKHRVRMSLFCLKLLGVPKGVNKMIVKRTHYSADCERFQMLKDVFIYLERTFINVHNLKSLGDY